MKIVTRFALLGSAVLILISTGAFAKPLANVGGDHVTPSLLPPIIGGVEVREADPVAASTVLIVGQDVVQGQKEEFICTGSIISQDLVLTAAHCLGESGNAKLVVAFRTKINGSGPVIGVVDQTRPSDFVSNSMRSQVDWDDIALVKLASPIPAGYRPAKVLNDPSLLRDGSDIELAGYGIDVPSDPGTGDGGSGILRKVDETVLQAHYGSTEVLVSLKDGGACHGDSGGPAFIRSGNDLYLFGVTSRLTNDDAIGTGRNPFLCSVDMVYTNILARAAWINAAAARLEQN